MCIFWCKAFLRMRYEGGESSQECEGVEKYFAAALA